MFRLRIYCTSMWLFYIQRAFSNILYKCPWRVNFTKNLYIYPHKYPLHISLQIFFTKTLHVSFTNILYKNLHPSFTNVFYKYTLQITIINILLQIYSANIYYKYPLHTSLCNYPCCTSYFHTVQCSSLVCPYPWLDILSPPNQTRNGHVLQQLPTLAPQIMSRIQV